MIGSTVGGTDLFLDGTGDGETEAAVTQSGIDRASDGAETFDIHNSGTGTMTLYVDGIEVVTTATDQDTQYLPGNQLQLVGGITFDVLEGASPGLDADLLDGQDSSAFLPADADLWVNETNDTMSGTLVLNPAAGNALEVSADIELGAGGLRKAGPLFLHDNGTSNTAIGLQALPSTTTGSSNIAVGENGLDSNTAGFATLESA